MDLYQGKETLEMLEDCRNYSNYLFQNVSKFLVKEDRVLDFGAGTGKLAAELKPRVRDMVAIEPDKFLRRELNKRGIPVERLEDLAAGDFNVIYCVNVLEHIKEDAATLSQLGEKLKPGGLLFVYVPAYPILYSPFDKRIGHFRRYTRRSLTELVNPSEFDLLQIRFHDPLGFFAALVYKVFSSTSHVPRGPLLFFDRFVFPLSVIMERVTGGWFGKNLSILVQKKGGQE